MEWLNKGCTGVQVHREVDLGKTRRGSTIFSRSKPSF